MMGRRIRELEAAVESRNNEIMQLKLRIDELNATVAQYRTQETAIAGALTRAQTAATGIIKDAENERDKILEQADAKNAEASREAGEIIEDAKHRADMIEQDAKDKAKDTASRAEGFMENYRANAQKLNDEIKRVAAEAAKYADEFSKRAAGLDLGAVIEMAGEYRGAAMATENYAEPLPDDYSDPKTLMHSIYAIERRSEPDDEAAGAADARETPADARETPADAAVQAEPSPEPEPEPPAAEDLTDADEEHVWTVEEIVERTNADENAAIDDELNAIIEDVLKGS